LQKEKGKPRRVRGALAFSIIMADA